MEKVEEIYTELKELNKKGDHDGLAEKMVDLQDYLTEQGYITFDLKPTEKGKKELSSLVDLMLVVRSEYSKEDEPVKDFSYLSWAWDWLISRGEKVK